MSSRQILLFAILALLVGLAALVAFNLWSGRGFLESPPNATAQNVEWLTVTNEAYEFRGASYQTPQELLVGLRQQQLKPPLVGIRWLMRGETASPSEVLNSRVSQARGALKEAGIASSSAVVGNELFLAEAPASSSVREPAASRGQRE